MVKDWVLKVESGLDGDSLSYLDMMERHSAEERRRAREREIMEEGKALWMAKKNEELELEHRDQEQIREMSRNKLFGRPGHGAPTDNIRKKKFTEYQLSEDIRRIHENPNANSLDNHYRLPSPPPAPPSVPRYRPSVENHEEDPLDVMTFGRPGCGAPVRTRSGRLRTTLVGNPEIRFQNNESVQKTIYNTIRYQTNKDDQQQYKRDLEEQIHLRRSMEKQEKERDVNIYRQLAQLEGTQWGRPGPGGTYWRDSAVTGQNFFDKMGWCGSADPRKRNFDIKQVETDDMKNHINENRQRRDIEHQEMNSNIGVELVPLLKEMSTGKPRKDPTTGYMMSHSLHTTDVTQSADPKRFDPMSSILMRGGDTAGEKKKYHDALHTQIVYKHEKNLQRRKDDQEEQKKHFENWETFWGRSGHGAPRANHGPYKENLMRILHYPTQKSPNSVELITLERLPVK